MTMDTPFGGFTEAALAAYQKALTEREGTDFSEGETYDFARCVRPDGSFYGTRGKCKKGKEAGAKEAEAPKSSGAVKPKRKLATSAEAKPAWQQTERVVKAAKENYKKVNAETKGDKSREAQKKRLDAGRALDKAERLAQKASDKLGAAMKRESRAAMTPEQRKEEREWQKTKKRLG